MRGRTAERVVRVTIEAAHAHTARVIAEARIAKRTCNHEQSHEVGVVSTFPPFHLSTFPPFPPFHLSTFPPSDE